MCEPKIPDELDTSNEWHVRASPSRDLILMGRDGEMIDFTRDQALVLASWLVAIADPEGLRFGQILLRVMER